MEAASRGGCQGPARRCEPREHGRPARSRVLAPLPVDPGGRRWLRLTPRTCAGGTSRPHPYSVTEASSHDVSRNLAKAGSHRFLCFSWFVNGQTTIGSFLRPMIRAAGRGLDVLFHTCSLSVHANWAAIYTGLENDYPAVCPGAIAVAQDPLGLIPALCGRPLQQYRFPAVATLSGEKSPRPGEFCKRRTG